MQFTQNRRFLGLNKMTVILGASMLLIITGAIWYLLGVMQLRTRQAEIARRGAQVMPFDLEQTTHVFKELDNGGLQVVTADDPADQRQITLIQSHLQQEAERFRQGDFSDPTAIHGEGMPGVAALKAGAKQIGIQYTPLPDGAQIRYLTQDPALVAALHEWFDAQLSDHGPHATDH